MALTTAEKISLFSILETPYAGWVDMPVDEYHLSAVRHNPTNVAEKIQTKINDRLLELTAEEEAVLVGYIAQWDTLSTCTASVDGSIGGVNGVAYDPFKQRALIQARVKIIIPVILYYEEITNSGVAGSAPFLLFGGR
jgi:hypothetical protein